MLIRSIVADLILMYFPAVLLVSKIFIVYAFGYAVYVIAFNVQLYMIFGIGLFFLGSWFVLWTRYAIPTNKNQERKLITRGNFAIIRHPMYKGWILINIGLALIVMHWSVIVLAFLQTIIYYLILCAEDSENVKLFGDEYRLYQKVVQRSCVILGVFRYFIRKIKKEKIIYMSESEKIYD